LDATVRWRSVKNLNAEGPGCCCRFGDDLVTTPLPEGCPTRNIIFLVLGAWRESISFIGINSIIRLLPAKYLS